MLVKNWISFLKKQKGLFTILMISQIFSLVCIYFVFGIFQNNIYELVDNEDTRSLNASLKGCKIQPSQLKDVMIRLVDENGFSIANCYIRAESTDKKWDYMDRCQYKDGEFSYSSIAWENMKTGMEGSMPDSEQYEDAEKVVVLGEGREEKIGDTLILEGERYQVIGINVMESDTELEIPFTAFPENCKWMDFHVMLEQLPTRTQYELFCNEMEEIGAKLDEFYIRNNADLKRGYSMIGVSIVLALLAGGNMYMVYRYIFHRRRRELVIYALCGCSKVRARRMFFGEIFLNMILVITIGTLLFRLFVYPPMQNWFRYLPVIYGIKEYLIIPAIFLVVILSIGYCLSRNMSKQSIVELRKVG